MFGVQTGPKSSRGSKSSAGEKKKKAVIREYEELYGINLSEEELCELIEDSFGNPDISSDTKKKIKKKLKDKKKKPEKEEKKEE